MAVSVRSVTVTWMAVATAVTAGVVLTFWVVLHPVAHDRCVTSLAPSTFSSALIPIHVVAAAVLSAGVWMLGARRRGLPLPDRPTLWGLGIGWTYVAATLLDHDLFGLLALASFVAAPTVGILAVLALLVRTLLAQRAGGEDDALWRDHAFSAQVLLWVGL